MLTHVIRPTLLLLGLCLVAGCGGGAAAPGDLIVGSWKHAGKVNEVIEFTKDGGLMLSDGTGALPPLRGRYTLTGDQLEMVITEATGKQTDDGTKYFAASWMNFEQLNAMMDRKEVKAVATATVTADKLTLRVDDTPTEYGRAGK